MSVRKNEQTQGKLQVLECAKKLLDYTILKCKSDKTFPKSTRWILANRIVNETFDLCSNIQKANTMRVEEEFEVRRHYQMQARANIDTLLMLLDVAYRTFGIEHRVIEYWTSLADDTLAKLNSWMKSDKERNKK